MKLLGALFAPPAVPLIFHIVSRRLSMRHLRHPSHHPACTAKTAPKEIIKLVERFEQNREQYTSGNYKEEQLRLEFLNPFFSALGWDLENRQGYAEPYKEVIHEDAFKIGSTTKAPDYAFRIGGTRKFFVEAKTPSVNLKEDFSPSYQETINWRENRYCSCSES